MRQNKKANLNLCKASQKSLHQDLDFQFKQEHFHLHHFNQEKQFKQKKKEHPVEAGQEIEPEAGEAHPVQLGRDVQQGVKQNDTQEWELLDESAPQAESPAVTHEAASPTVWSPTSPARSPTRSPSSEAPTLLLPEGQEENFALMEEMAKVKSEMKEIKEELKEEEKESFEEEPSEKEGDTETPSL